MKRLIIILLAFISYHSNAQVAKRIYSTNWKNWVQEKHNIQKLNSARPHQYLYFDWKKDLQNWDYQYGLNIEYLANGNKSKEFAISNQGLPLFRNEYAYDAKDQLIMVINQTFQINKWINESKITYSYDSLDKINSEEYWRWEDNDWVIYDGTKTNTININNEQIITTTLKYDLGLGKYLNSTRIIERKENQVLFESETQTFQNNQWEPTYIEAYDFDLNGKITSLITANWDGVQWVNQTKLNNIQWVANSIEKPLSYEQLSWVDNQWKVESKFMFGYSNNESTSIVQLAFIDNQWVNFGRYIDLIDDHNNRILFQFELFNDKNWEVSYAFKYLRTYDWQNNLSEIITQYFDGFTFENISKEIYDAYQTTTGISNSKKNEIQIFPNPTTEFISINSDKIEGSIVDIINSNGEFIKSIEVNNREQKIDVSELANGIYLLKIKTNQGDYHSKFIKQ